MEKKPAKVEGKTDQENRKLKRKTSIKEKPVIKQTKTSMIRMMKANPLLLKNSDTETEKTNEIAGFQIPKSFSNINIGIKSYNMNITNGPCEPSASTSKFLKTEKAKDTFTNQPVMKNLNIIKPRTENNFRNEGKTQKSTEVPFKKPYYQISKPKNKILSSKDTKIENADSSTCTGKPKRRSLSAEHFDRQNKKINNLYMLGQERHGIQKNCDMENTKLKRKSLSAENFHIKFLQTDLSKANLIEQKKSSADISPINKDLPKLTQTSKRVFFSTPLTPNKVTYELSKRDICLRLNEWLKNHGRPSSMYGHLKCFGIQASDINKLDEENKENIEDTKSAIFSQSYEDLEIGLQEASSSKENLTLKNEELQAVATDALGDLHNLINEGYSNLQCLIWINLIREKCPYIENHPKYWECRAALEQTKGNLTNAIECYKKAIVKGANVQQVDNALEDLLRKFSLLDISDSNANTNSDEKLKREKAFLLQEIRNTFKSSIIQFAVKEKKSKSNGEDVQQIVVTPVRRSMRLLRSYVPLTPGMQVCSSLSTFEPEKMVFKNNPALSVRYN